MKRFLALIIAMLMTAMLLPLTACVTPTPPGPGPGPNPDDPKPVAKVEYTVSVLSYGNKKVNGASVQLFDGTDVAVAATTDETGKVKLSAEPKEYEVRLAKVPEGYDAPTETYTTDTTGEKEIEIRINSHSEAAYYVSVLSSGGDKLRNVIVELLYNGTIAASGATDTNGNAVIYADRNEYEVRLSNIPAGYGAPAQTYQTDADGEKQIKIYLDSHIIETPATSGYVYGLGDVMHDFTITTSTGTKFNLIEEFETKKAVFINFWATWCTPCKSEFPALAEAYELFKDDISVIALSPFDDNSGIEEFKKQNSNLGINFDMAYDMDIYRYFGGDGTVPMSVMIDRYGVFAWTHTGSIPTTQEFVQLFERFTSPDYTQVIIRPDGSGSDTPAEKPKPNVDMPASSVIESAINGAGFNGTYRPETEAEDKDYYWPFVVGEENGTKFIYASNKGIQNYSFAAIHVDFSIKKGQVLTFDYFLSTETGSDLLYILLDNEGRDVVRLSGISNGWETFYLYAEIEDGNHTLTFLYYTDEMNDPNDNYTDDVRIRNIRFSTVEDIKNNGASLDNRYFCTTNFNEAENKWTNYVEVGLNQNDGYYHLLDEKGEPNGPYVLADMGYQNSHWSNLSLYEYANSKQCIFEGKDYNALIMKYCGYATNSDVSGYVPVPQELHDVLVLMAKYLGNGKYDNEWLEMCSYYIHYGVGEGIADKDPIKGIAPVSAYELHETTGTDDLNTIVVDRFIMPRGLYYKFVPSQTAVYEFKSYANIINDDYVPMCWIVDESGNLLCDDENENAENFTMYAALEAGKTYYALCDMYNLNLSAKTFTWPMAVTNVGASKTILRTVTTGYYVYDPDILEKEDIVVNYMVLYTDYGQDVNGNWIAKKKDGSKMGDIYIDFFANNYLLPNTCIADILVPPLDKDGNPVRNRFYLSDKYGRYVYQEDENGNYVLDENGNPIPLWDYMSFDLSAYGYSDYTDIMMEYLEEAKLNNGLVKVDEQLGTILDEFIRVINETRENEAAGIYIKDHWLRMCWYSHTYSVNDL